MKSELNDKVVNKCEKKPIQFLVFILLFLFLLGAGR